MKQVYPKGWTLADEMQWEQQINQITAEPHSPMRQAMIDIFSDPATGREDMRQSFDRKWLTPIKIPPPTWWQNLKWRFRNI